MDICSCFFEGSTQAIHWAVLEPSLPSFGTWSWQLLGLGGGNGHQVASCELQKDWWMHKLFLVNLIRDFRNFGRPKYDKAIMCRQNMGLGLSNTRHRSTQTGMYKLCVCIYRITHLFQRFWGWWNILLHPKTSENGWSLLKYLKLVGPWFQILFMFTPILGGNDPIWRAYFFKWVETTN